MKRYACVVLLMCLLLVSCGRNNYKDLHDAVGHGTPKDVQRFLDAGWDPNARDTWGITPLLGAAVNKRHGVAVARLLLDRGANIDAQDTNVGCTAIDIACGAGQIELVKFLLDSGADPNLPNKKGTHTIDAVVCYPRNGIPHGPELLQLLLDAGADPNGRSGDGWPVICGAAWYGNCEEIKILLQHGADVNAKRNDGSTALDCANKAGMTDIAELLRANGAKTGNELAPAR